MIRQYIEIWANQLEHSDSQNYKNIVKNFQRIQVKISIYMGRITAPPYSCIITWSESSLSPVYV